MIERVALSGGQSGSECVEYSATWDDIFEHRYRSQMQPEVLIANLNAIQARYDVHLVFCKSEYSGKLIKCLLYREFKELLQQGKFDDMTL